MLSFQPFKHYNTHLEEIILGSCMVENDAYTRVRNILEPIHFYTTEHQQVFECLTKMWDEGLQIDLITVTHYMTKLGYRNKIDNIAYFLTHLTESVLSTGHLETHSIILRELYAERECLLIQADAGKIEGDAIGKMADIQERLKKALSIRGTDDWRDMSQVSLTVTHHMEEVKGKELMGIPSGFEMLDAITYGFQKGELIVVGARPSVGKSAFAGGIALSAALKGFNIGIVSLEMPEVQIGSRMLALYSDMEFWRIYRNNMIDSEQERIFFNNLSNFATLPISLSDKTNVTISDIRAKAYKLHKKGKLDFLILDYLQLVETEGKQTDTREREVAKLSRGLKLLAMDLKIPVLLLAQLNRQSEGRNDKKPRLSDLRESGAIEQDADVVLILHRDWKAGIQNDAQGISTEKQATILIEKCRNGECKEIKICFDPEKIKFHDEVKEVAFNHFDKPNAGIKVQYPVSSQDKKEDNPF